MKSKVPLLTLILLICTVSILWTPPAHAQRVDVYGPIVWPADPPFFPLPQTNYIVVCDQLQHHDISFRANDTPMGPASGWYEFAYWSCYHERQTIVAFFPYGHFPTTFFRTIGNNCNGGGGAIAAVPQRRRGCVVAVEWFHGFEGPVTGPPRELKLKPGRTWAALRAALK